MNWFAIQVKYGSQETIVKKFEYYEAVLDLKISEFYYPTIKTNGKKILILPRYLFVRAKYISNFEFWEEAEEYIVSFMRTRDKKKKYGDVMHISDQEMIDFKNGIKEYETTGGGFVVGKKITFKTGPFVGYTGVLQKFRKNLCVVKIEGFKSEDIPIIVKRDSLRIA